MNKPSSNESNPRTFAFVSLGCPKNLVDSERMLGKLAQDGYALQADTTGADVVVINTCGFIEPARQESLAVIREMLELKKQGKIGAVVVAGCLAERQKDLLLEQVPDVDQIVGVFGREEIVGRSGPCCRATAGAAFPVPTRSRARTGGYSPAPHHPTSLCLHEKFPKGVTVFVTFCAIPKMRGKHATKPMEEVIREATETGRRWRA